MERPHSQEPQKKPSSSLEKDFSKTLRPFLGSLIFNTRNKIHTYTKEEVEVFIDSILHGIKDRTHLELLTLHLPLSAEQFQSVLKLPQLTSRALGYMIFQPQMKDPLLFKEFLSHPKITRTHLIHLLEEQILTEAQVLLLLVHPKCTPRVAQILACLHPHSRTSIQLLIYLFGTQEKIKDLLETNPLLTFGALNYLVKFTTNDTRKKLLIELSEKRYSE